MDLLPEEKNKFHLKYLSLPASVLFNKELDKNASILFGLIHLLDDVKKHCWASNAYFATMLDVSTTTISTSISLLLRLNYIELAEPFNGKRRCLKVSDKYEKTMSSIENDINNRHDEFVELQESTLSENDSRTGESLTKTSIKEPLNFLKGSSDEKNDSLEDNLKHNIIVNSFFTKVKKGMSSTSVRTLENEIKKVKITRPVPKQLPVSLTEDEFLNEMNYSSQEAKECFLFWNSLPNPIRHHKLDRSTKVFKTSLDAIDCALKKHSIEAIKAAMNSYCQLLRSKSLTLSLSAQGVNVPLNEFFVPSTMTTKIYARDGIPVAKTWFKECVNNPLPSLLLRYSRELPDKHPEITEALKKSWPGNKRTLNIQEENIFKKTAERAYNYFIGLNDFRDGMGTKHKYPVTCIGFIWEFMKEKEGFDFSFIPYWIQGERFFQRLDAFLREKTWIIPGYDARREATNERTTEEMAARLAEEKRRDDKDRLEALEGENFD